ncbi:glycosyltransferase [Capnocytophaga sp. oral taxon 323]|nr:glycosyltransferase [Capnocytophaga sp. oral taxon 323]
MKKRCIETVRRVRKETEMFGRGEGGFLMKKGYEKGGGSL